MAPRILSGSYFYYSNNLLHHPESVDTLLFSLNQHCKKMVKRFEYLKEDYPKLMRMPMFQEFINGGDWESVTPKLMAIQDLELEMKAISNGQ